MEEPQLWLEDGVDEDEVLARYADALDDFARGCYIVKLMRGDAVVKYEKLLVK